MNPNLPKTSGSYALLLFLPRRMRIAVGGLGDIEFKRGYYVYMGSAFGPGGVRARVRRHLVKDKKMHWHIDYFRTRADVKEIWVTCCRGNMEHQWAQSLLSRPAECVPIHHFGSSDCTCPGHLFYFKACPDMSLLAGAKDPMMRIKVP